MSQFRHTVRSLRRAFATAAVASLAFTSLCANAQDQDQADITTVVVTGTHIRTTDQGALPVQTITSEQIQQSGATSPEQFLQSVSVAVQGNTNSVAATGSGATSGGVSTVSLRGLGSQRTLVLLDGRRIAGGGTITDSTSVDVNSIPLSALQKVDVLKEGASAVYGSDAIAGVVNFVLKDNYQGAEITGFGGGTSDGGGAIKRANALVGFGSLTEDRYNVLLTGNFQKESPLYGSQRSFAASGISVANNNDVTSGNTFPANVVDVDQTLNTFNPKAGNCAPSVADPLNDPADICRYDPSPFVALLPDTERYSVFAAAHFALTSDVQLYGEAGYSHNRQFFSIQPNPISNQFALAPNNPLFNVDPYDGATTVILKPSSAFYPTAYVQSITGGATPDLNVFYRDQISGNRDLTDTSEQPRVVLGIKGTSAGWDFDGSALYSETRLTETTNSGYPAYTVILPLLNSGLVNFFGPNTPDIVAQAKAADYDGTAYKTKTSIAEVQGFGSREIVQLPAGALAIAVGASYRKEKFVVDPSAAIQSGDISGYGGNYLPESVQRNVYGIFAEANVPIVQGLTADLAVRYDDYQNTGSKTTPQVSLRWKQSDMLLVRGSYGRGFRAPSLTELYQPQTVGVTASGLNDPLRCATTGSSLDCATQFNETVGGNTALKPETSDNYTLGFVFSPNRNISLGVDGFDIKLKNTIIFGVPPQAIFGDLTTYGALVTRGAPTANCPGCAGPITSINQLNSNFGETKVAGYDVDFRWRIPTAAIGTFQFSVIGSYFATYQIQNPDGSFSNIAGMVTGITNGSGGVIPRWHHYATLDWNMGPWEAAVSQNYQSSYRDLLGTNEDNTVPGFVERNVSSYSTVDLQVGFNGIPNAKIAVGLRNALDKDPPYTNAGGQNYFQSGYDPGYADPRGRFIYGSVTYSFAPAK